ncbi:hypothetical protein Bbelb_240080 [Branchiostoma belcheri]|nr:hypothetical protein Bbelb_240080 [Branchiostoma belcheri]
MESGTIPDDSITASSTWGVAHEAYRGRLNGVAGGGAWVVGTNAIGEWLQVDLGEMETVTGTIIQGCYSLYQWVTSYKLQYSIDGLSWITYTSSDGSEQVFPGNTDRNTPVTNLLDCPTDAQYVRFLPQSWHVWMSMRAEVLSCSVNAWPTQWPLCQVAYSDCKVEVTSEQNTPPDDQRCHVKLDIHEGIRSESSPLVVHRTGDLTIHGLVAVEECTEHYEMDIDWSVWSDPTWKICPTAMMSVLSYALPEGTSDNELNLLLTANTMDEGLYMIQTWVKFIRQPIVASVGSSVRTVPASGDIRIDAGLSYDPEGVLNTDTFTYNWTCKVVELPPSLDVTTVNIARCKATATASSSVTGTPDMVIDGNNDGQLPSCVFELQQSGNEWWMVDLNHPGPIDRIVIYGRTDDHWDSLNPLDVYMGNSAQLTENTLVASSLNLTQQQTTMTVHGNSILAQYVGLFMSGEGHRKFLCEVEVFTNDIAYLDCCHVLGPQLDSSPPGELLYGSPSNFPERPLGAAVNISVHVKAGDLPSQEAYTVAHVVTNTSLSELKLECEENCNPGNTLQQKPLQLYTASEILGTTEFTLEEHPAGFLLQNWHQSKNASNIRLRIPGGVFQAEGFYTVRFSDVSDDQTRISEWRFRVSTNPTVPSAENGDFSDVCVLLPAEFEDPLGPLVTEFSLRQVTDTGDLATVKFPGDTPPTDTEFIRPPLRYWVTEKVIYALWRVPTPDKESIWGVSLSVTMVTNVTEMVSGKSQNQEATTVGFQALDIMDDIYLNNLFPWYPDVHLFADISMRQIHVRIQRESQTDPSEKVYLVSGDSDSLVRVPSFSALLDGNLPMDETVGIQPQKGPKVVYPFHVRSKEWPDPSAVGHRTLLEHIEHCGLPGVTLHFLEANFNPFEYSNNSHAIRADVIGLSLKCGNVTIPVSGLSHPIDILTRRKNESLEKSLYVFQGSSLLGNLTVFEFYAKTPQSALSFSLEFNDTLFPQDISLFLRTDEPPTPDVYNWSTVLPVATDQMVSIPWVNGTFLNSSSYQWLLSAEEVDITPSDVDNLTAYYIGVRFGSEEDLVLRETVNFTLGSYRGRRAGSGWDACSELPDDLVTLKFRLGDASPPGAALVRQLKTTAEGLLSNATHIHCRCNHLTKFSAFVAPNPLNIQEAGIGILPGHVLNTRKDCQYIITVYTGYGTNAGTTAEVKIALNSLYEEATPFTLRDQTRFLFEKGGVDSFLVSTEQPIGGLTHVRVWHDSGGHSPGWWLAADEDDGKVHRVLPKATPDEMTNFRNLFLAKSASDNREPAVTTEDGTHPGYGGSTCHP